MVPFCMAHYSCGIIVVMYITCNFIIKGFIMLNHKIIFFLFLLDS